MSFKVKFNDAVATPIHKFVLVYNSKPHVSHLFSCYGHLKNIHLLSWNENVVPPHPPLPREIFSSNGTIFIPGPGFNKTKLEIIKVTNL